MKLNGREISHEGKIQLDIFLENQGYKLTRIAAELNGRIIPKAEYSTTFLEDEDSLEVVTFVGGG